MANGRAIVALAKAAVENLEKTIANHDVQCDYEPVGNVVTAVTPKQSEKLAAWSRACAALGLENELLEGSALRERGLPPTFQRALSIPQGGIINPGKLVVGLAKAAERAGAKLYEGTRVQRIEQGERILLHTPKGRVRANAIVLAANGFSEELGVTGRKIVMIQTQLLMTEPLTAAQLDATGWHSRAAIITKHWTMESYRLTTDDRIVAGSKRVRYGYGGAPLRENASIHRLLERTFRERFPMLVGVEIASRWSGPLGLTLAVLPFVSRMGKHRNVLCCGGYSGAGMPLAVHAGELLADLWAGEGELARPLLRKGISFPPEPLSYLGANFVTSMMNRMDAAEDRRARKES
jgi:glycine/D-amino acid oxidase-like deaminating enzyme